jgi:hypothetical protein
LDFDFLFGINQSGAFYVKEPAILATFSLNNSEPLSINLMVGPLGIGVQDGKVDFTSQVRIGSDATLGVDQLTGGNPADLIGLPSVGIDSGYDISLPVVMQGTIPGLDYDNATPVRLFASSSNGILNRTSPAGFFSGMNLGVEGDLSDLFSFDNISLDLVLDVLGGSDPVAVGGLLGELVDPQGVAYAKLPVMNKSLVELLGSADKGIVQDIKTVLEGVRNFSDNVVLFERELNSRLNAALGLGGAVDSAAIGKSTQDLSDISATLDGGSSNEEIAIALADIDLFRARAADRNLLAARDRLATTVPGFDGNATNFEIAFALAQTFRPGVFALRQADRDLLQAIPGYPEAINRLAPYGLNGGSTDDEITVVFDSDTAAIDNAKADRDLVSGRTVPARAAAFQSLVALGPGFDGRASDLDIAVALTEAQKYAGRIADRNLLNDSIVSVPAATANLVSVRKLIRWLILRVFSPLLAGEDQRQQWSGQRGFAFFIASMSLFRVSRRPVA